MLFVPDPDALKRQPREFIERFAMRMELVSTNEAAGMVASELFDDAVQLETVMAEAGEAARYARTLLALPVLSAVK
jgi:hypothetical protein